MLAVLQTTDAAANFYLSTNAWEPEEGDIKNLIVDCKGLEYVSSAGLRVLLGTQKKMSQVGTMKVINVCEEVMEELKFQ